jgi:hypothetical protein
VNERLGLQKDAIEGARNLLLNCAEVSKGDHLLIMHEDPALGWYDSEAPALVAQVARQLGIKVTLREVGGPDNGYLHSNTRTPGDADLCANRDDYALVDAGYDCCIFFARIGDQLRFDPAIEGRRRVMCYVTSLASLASRYGRIKYTALAELKQAIDNVMLSATDIAISCPLGTNLRGRLHDHPCASSDEVSVLRFPVGVHAPIDASRFSGYVRVARYLTPTGSRVYTPASVAIDQPVTADVLDGKIRRYAGNVADVQNIERHYANVASKFALDSKKLLSWHAGIHPGCHYIERVDDNPDRWSNTVFTNPRFVHFHTCGNTAPGEICWMVRDPTIAIDGVPLWDFGTLRPERVTETEACLQRWPQLRELYAQINGEVGV